MKDKVITLETSLKSTYHKVRGLSEGKEYSHNLTIFIRTWLANVMNSEEEIFPIMLKAYRIGQQNVVVVLGDERIQNENLTIARNKGTLKHQEDEVKVFPDIPFETLQLRRKLKATMQKLREANLRYKWQTNRKLSNF